MGCGVEEAERGEWKVYTAGGSSYEVDLDLLTGEIVRSIISGIDEAALAFRAERVVRGFVLEDIL